MFGSEILDVAIGLALVFLLMSFIATAIREAIESVVKARAVHLERGIRELLDDPTGDGIAQAFYEHPLIFSLFHGDYSVERRRFFGSTLPTYIPKKNFADTVIDLAIRGPVQSEYAIMQTAAKTSVTSLRANIGRLRSPRLIRAVLTAMDHSGDDLNIVRENLQTWFDSGMDRVSGRYKRRTQFWLFLIGLGLAGVLNVNAIVITNHLARNKALRESLVARAQAATKDTQYQRMLADTNFRLADARRSSTELTSLDLPIGIERYQRPGTAADWIRLLGGLLVTAFAVTLGAPFWFDALNKMMVIRSTVKPHEKSPEESSEDRQTSKDRSTRTAASPDSEPAKSEGKTTPTPPVPPMPPEQPAATGATSRADAHEWASGEPDEGML